MGQGPCCTSLRSHLEEQFDLLLPGERIVLALGPRLSLVEGCSSLTQLFSPWGGRAGARKHFRADGQRYEQLGIRFFGGGWKGGGSGATGPLCVVSRIRTPERSVCCSQLTGSIRPRNRGSSFLGPAEADSDPPLSFRCLVCALVRPQKSLLFKRKS